MNGEISKIFRYIKAHEEQPGRELFCLPSGLATFTCFALRLALLNNNYNSVALSCIMYIVLSSYRCYCCFQVLGSGSVLLSAGG